MPAFDDIKRSRFKMTALTIGVLVVMSFLPTYIILKASTLDKFELAAAWSAWGLCIVGIGTVSGNYVMKETQRSSFMGVIGGITGFKNKIPKPQILENQEDFSDPQQMPI